MRTSVDLPQPDGPMTHMNSRRCARKLTSSSARVVPPSRSAKSLTSPRTSRMTGRSLSLRKRSATSGVCSR